MRVVPTQLTSNIFVENPSHTPCVQHRTCILQSSTHYTLLPSYHTALWFTTNPSQTSVLLPIIYFWQFREWPESRQHTRTLRWRRRFPNSTYRWWTLDNRYSTWKNILHTWKWLTQQCMSIPMPLWEQWHCLIHGQPRLEWYFGLWGLHDDH